MNSSTHLALLFVFLWSTSFFAVQFCSPHVEPATFIAIRAGITAFVLYIIVIFSRANWPSRWVDCVPCVVVGILMHGVYGGGVFASFYKGIDITLLALILSLQPIVTVILSAVFLKENITTKKTIGIMAGFVGVTVMILGGNPTSNQTASVNGVNAGSGNETIAITLCVLALMAISAGAILQKKYCANVEPLPGAFIQFTGAAYFMIPFALVFETMQVNWIFEFVASLGWLVVIVSISATTLLMILIKNDKPSAVANLFYLITPLVAIESWILLGEKLSLLEFAGILLCMSGVFIVNYSKQAKPKRASVDLKIVNGCR